MEERAQPRRKPAVLRIGKWIERGGANIQRLEVWGCGDRQVIPVDGRYVFA